MGLSKGISLLPCGSAVGPHPEFGPLYELYQEQAPVLSGYNLLEDNFGCQAGCPCLNPSGQQTFLSCVGLDTDVPLALRHMHLVQGCLYNGTL